MFTPVISFPHTHIFLKIISCSETYFSVDSSSNWLINFLINVVYKFKYVNPKTALIDRKLNFENSKFPSLYFIISLIGNLTN